MCIDARPTSTTRLFALLIPLLLTGGFAAAGEIYTWRDANGVVHYSDVKPEGDKVKVLKAGTQRDLPGSTGASPAPKQESAAVDPEAAFRKRRTEAAEAQAKADKERQEADARKENCDAARNQLTALRSGERMARYNAAGEKEVLDDAAREAEITRVQRTVDSSCK
jgi:uncharacterized protein DUF4124